MSAGSSALTINRHFDAPVATVFAAWTDPASPVGWWGPKGFTLEFYESDLRPNGQWRIGMRSAEGELMVSAGTYQDIVAPTRLVMTHSWENPGGQRGPETLVTITLEEQDGGTAMTFVQTGFDSAASRDGHAGGWGEAFDALAAGLHGRRS